jgi:agmatinase
MLRQLTGINIVGADVVEVAPAYDHAEITCVAAATVVFDLLSLIVANNSPPVVQPDQTTGPSPRT